MLLGLLSGLHWAVISKINVPWLIETVRMDSSETDTPRRHSIWLTRRNVQGRDRRQLSWCRLVTIKAPSTECNCKWVSGWDVLITFTALSVNLWQIFMWKENPSWKLTGICRVKLRFTKSRPPLLLLLLGHTHSVNFTYKVDGCNIRLGITHVKLLCRVTKQHPFSACPLVKCPGDGRERQKIIPKRINGHTGRPRTH